MTNKYIYTASYCNVDEDDEKMIKASTSLLKLQTYCMKKAEKIVKLNNEEISPDYCSLYRRRKGNIITLIIHRFDEKWDVIEWFTIKRVTLL